MKIAHRLEPLIHMKEKSDDIRTYGAIQVNLLFMLDIDDPALTEEALKTMGKRMMRAACDEVDVINKEGTPTDEHLSS